MIFTIKRVEKYTPIPWGISSVENMRITRRVTVDIWYAWSVVKDQDHDEEECTHSIKCANCQKSHPVFAKSCYIYKREK